MSNRIISFLILALVGSTSAFARPCRIHVTDTIKTFHGLSGPTHVIVDGDLVQERNTVEEDYDSIIRSLGHVSEPTDEADYIITMDSEGFDYQRFLFLKLDGESVVNSFVLLDFQGNELKRIRWDSIQCSKLSGQHYERQNCSDRGFRNQRRFVRAKERAVRKFISELVCE